MFDPATDNIYSGIKKIAPSASSTILALALVVCTNITPPYASLNLNSFMNDKTASKLNQNLDGSIIALSNSGTNESIYTSSNDLKFIDEVNIEDENDTEDLLDWDIWIDNPPVTKTITIDAKFVKGSYILPSIFEDEDPGG